jgi:hypothetical protein
MKPTMVRYRVKADRAEENERFIARVFEQLRRDAPAGLRYASFKLPDGVTFVHLVSADDEAGRVALRELPAFKAFTASIRERCDEPPASTELNEVGSYRFFGG